MGRKPKKEKRKAKKIKKVGVPLERDNPQTVLNGGEIQKRVKDSRGQKKPL